MSSDGLREIIRGEITEFLRDPFANLPSEMKSYIPNIVELVGIVVPRGNVFGAYTTASDVSGLGEPAHGRPCTVRAGASPFEFIQMTYDEVYGKWVSSQVWFAAQLSASFASAGTSYADVSATNIQRLLIPNFKVLYDAGLRPQCFLSTQITAAIGNTGHLQLTIGEIETGDTAHSGIATSDAEITRTAVTQFVTSTGWTSFTFSSPPADDHAEIVAQVKHTGSAVSFQRAQYALRWVADPA